MGTDFSKKNRKFIGEYQLENDGTLADVFMTNCKRVLAEDDALTPEQREMNQKHYQQKMSEIIATATSSPEYVALFKTKATPTTTNTPNTMKE